MTAERLHKIKTVTTWLGVFVTFCGIVMNVVIGGSLGAAVISILGLMITCAGHWATSIIAKHQKAEKEADKELIDELHGRVEYAEQRFEDPDLQRMIKRESSRYADEHQDDGK